MLVDNIGLTSALSDALYRPDVVHDRGAVMRYLYDRQSAGVVPTGLLFVDETAPEMHEIAGSVEQPLNQVPFEKLCPGHKALDELQEAFR